MLMFSIGFLVAFILMMFAGSLATKYAIKKGWYASAMWSDKDKVWKVRGSYLAISGKIFTGIQDEKLTGVKSVKYMH